MNIHRDSHRILVVDDEPSIVDAVATALRYEGYEVDEAFTGREALEPSRGASPTWSCSTGCSPTSRGSRSAGACARAASRRAVLFLTAKDATEDKVEALRAGGDDYVTKPFSLAEIVARIQAILRRTAGDAARRRAALRRPRARRGRHEVYRGETPIALTATEFSLLRYFMLNPRRVLSKSQILQNVWHYDFGGNANVVETYVSYLRRKLDAAGPPLIRTIRQAGYMLEAGRT